MAGNAPRFSRLSPEQLSERQKPVVARLAKSVRNGLGGPFDVMLRSPDMAHGMVELFEYYRFKSKLPHRLKELAILILAREWTAQFEWFAHQPAARNAGLADAVIEDLRQGLRPAAMAGDETVIFDFAIALIRDHEVSDPVFAQARDLLGDEQLVDLITLVGEYMKVALLLNTARIGVPEGQEPPLPPLARGAAR
ncbi:MAG: carboxymuconolactone decarboxylase family protein [Alphaproteobacteria bacterium]|nr:carboxymuconolactone decarboxylase family protein [Alphaproteobacteria bacterium]